MANRRNVMAGSRLRETPFSLFVHYIRGKWNSFLSEIVCVHGVTSFVIFLRRRISPTRVPRIEITMGCQKETTISRIVT